jgi:hypothetical protein
MPFYILDCEFMKFDTWNTIGTLQHHSCHHCLLHLLISCRELKMRPLQRKLQSRTLELLISSWGRDWGIWMSGGPSGHSSNIQSLVLHLLQTPRHHSDRSRPCATPQPQWRCPTRPCWESRLSDHWLASMSCQVPGVINHRYVGREGSGLR